ncbi:MAG TPA: hypothetical protein VNL94_02585 [Candidatus Binatia bacterium]|nr:hypothetical protein [Candidatus Binatia bacterium]
MPPDPRELDAVPAFLRRGVRAPSPAAQKPTRRTTRAARAASEPKIPPYVPPTPVAAFDDEDDPGPRLDPATLPMPRLSRRRVVTAAGVLASALLALSFARQVGEATAATSRAEELRANNAALREEVERLEQDLGRVQDQRFVKLQARAYGLGGPREIPFALAAGAPSLPPDAPGSAAVRLGAEVDTTTPLEAWLEVLFGPSD